MENPALNHLPEAHSLPDGFVESSLEPLEEQEKPPQTDYKEETLAEIETCTESQHDLPVAASSFDSVVVKVRVEKLRTFPVSLAEKDGSGENEEVTTSVGRKN